MSDWMDILIKEKNESEGKDTGDSISTSAAGIYPASQFGSTPYMPDPKVKDDVHELLDVPRTTKLLPMGTTLKTGKKQRDALKRRSARIRKFEQAHSYLERETVRQEALVPGAMEILTEDIFPVFGVGTAGPAGFLMQYQDTGDILASFQRAGRETAQVLPGINEYEKSTTGASYTQLAFQQISRMSELQKDIFLPSIPMPGRSILEAYGIPGNRIRLIDDKGVGVLGTAALGFFFDVMLDPLTYIPLGKFQSGAKSLARTARETRRVLASKDPRAMAANEALENTIHWFSRNMHKATDLVSGSKDAAVKRQMKKLREKDEPLLALLEEGGINAGELVENYNLLAEAKLRNMLLTADEVGRKIFAHLDEPEITLLGLTLSIPDHMIRSRIKAATHEGFLEPGRVETIMESVDDFRRVMKGYFDEAVEWDILDQHQAVENYTMAVNPIDLKSERMMNRVFNDLGIPHIKFDAGKDTPFPGQGRAAGHFPDDKQMTFQMEKKYANSYDRMLEGELPTELNAWNIFKIRSFQQARAITTRELYKSTLSNPAISHRLTDPIDPAALQTLRDKGYDKFTFKSTVDGKTQEADYLLPQSIVKTMTDTRELFLNPKKLDPFLRTLNSVTATWKGWAVATPGYHARNNWNGGLVNWQAGLGRPHGEKYTHNVPSWLVRGVRSVVGPKDAPRTANAQQLYVAAAKITGGGSLDVLGSSSVNSMMKKLGAGKIEDLEDLAHIPKILDETGKVMTGPELLSEMKEVDVLFGGWLGRELTDAETLQFFRRSSKGARHKEGGNTYTVNKESISRNDFTLSWKDAGNKEIGSLRIYQGSIQDIKIPEAGRNLVDRTETELLESMLGEAIMKGGRTLNNATIDISPSITITADRLREIGFEKFPGNAIPSSKYTQQAQSVGEIVDESPESIARGLLEGPKVDPQSAITRRTDAELVHANTIESLKKAKQNTRQARKNWRAARLEGKSEKLPETDVPGDPTQAAKGAAQAETARALYKATIVSKNKDEVLAKATNLVKGTKGAKRKKAIAAVAKAKKEAGHARRALAVAKGKTDIARKDVLEGKVPATKIDTKAVDQQLAKAETIEEKARAAVKVAKRKVGKAHREEAQALGQASPGAPGEAKLADKAADIQAAEIKAAKQDASRRASIEEEPIWVVRSADDGTLDRTTRAVLEAVTGIGPMDYAKRIFGPDNPALEANRAFGAFIENIHRGALYLDRRHRGLDKFEASRDVRLWHLDYGDLADFEKQVMREIWPFYTWWRKNLSLQFWAMTNNPGRYAQIPKAMQSFEEMSADWKDIPMPDYHEEVSMLRTPLQWRNRMITYTPDFGFNDINSLNVKDFITRAHPFIKISGESIFTSPTGYNVFTESASEYYPGQEGQYGLRRRTQGILENLMPPLGTTSRALQAVGKSPEDLFAWFSSTIGGTRIKFNDVQRNLRKRNVKLDKAQQAHIKKKLDDRRSWLDKRLGRFPPK